MINAIMLKKTHDIIKELFKMNTEHFDCECHSNEHTIRISYDKDYFFIESFLLVQPWYKRIKTAILYLFGHRSKYGDFSCWILKDSDIERMLKLLGDYYATRNNEIPPNNIDANTIC